MANRSGIVKTSRGVTLDMNRLSKENSTVVAMTAGGVSMNARGDILGRGGKVIRTREDLEKAYHQANQKATKHVAARPVSITKTHISPDNLPEDIKLKMEEVEKSSKKKVDTSGLENVTLEEAANVLEEAEEASPRRKRKTTTEE